jgi:hypothetical protein
MSTYLFVLLFSPSFAQQTAQVNDFETQIELRHWEINAGKPSLVSEGVTHGKNALQIEFDPKAKYSPAYMYWNRVRKDWSPYDALVIDVFNPNGRPIKGYILIADQAWKDNRSSYWNRHNGNTSFPPGKSQWVISVHGIYRGEAGNRNNDVKRNIDPDSIVRMDLGFGGRGEEGRVILDNIRFVKIARPAGIWAFDFGPPSQPTMLGWSAVSNATRFSTKSKFGWLNQNPWQGAARDTTFGTPLTQDFCAASGYNFRIDTGDGEYKVMVIYENSGYWGGEQSKHSSRRILVNGKQVWQEIREHGSAHALFRFEDVEPVGVDIWDTYMAAELVKPVTFNASAKNGSLTLRFEADKTWGSKISGIAIHKVGDADSATWLSGQMDALATEFRRKAANLDERKETPAEWRKQDLIVWPVTLEETVTPHSVPQQLPNTPSVTRTVARGEFEPFCIAVRPTKTFKDCRLVLSPFKGPGQLDAKVQVVRYNTSRGFGNIAYHIRPHSLRDQKQIDLPADITRQLIVTANVSTAAAPGDYAASLDIVGSNNSKLVSVPLHLKVVPVVINRESDYTMGFFGLMPPGLLNKDERWQNLEETLVLLKEHGMNGVCGGPSWTLTGWNNGEPQIDYGEVDRFFALLRKHGFKKAINGYGGLRFRGLHHRYEKGKEAAKVEKESGMPYEEAFLKAWEAVHKHARQNHWATIFYAMCDETRVREVAERELAFMKLMSKASDKFPETVRTSGSYSVHFRTRPQDKEDLLYWHQRYFENLDINSLNNHDQTVMDEANRLGREIHIYNQGRSRYSFGLYQWSEFRKGVTARWQWHLNILHGYQFFDLDGREPDNAMICYGRKGIYPTIHFERCREGAEDFYLYSTLWKLIQIAKERTGTPKTTAAIAAAELLLEGALSKVKINQRKRPDGFDPDKFKLKVLDAIQSLQ